MPTAKAIFSGNIAASQVATTYYDLIQASQGWVGIVLDVKSVSGTDPSIVFGLQWSLDGATWADADGARDEFDPIASPLTVARRFDVKAQYFRAYVTVSGTDASFTGSANAYY